MPTARITASYTQGKLMARPRELGKPATGQPRFGLHLLSGTAAKGSLIYVPQTLEDSPAPLVVIMHGASGTAEGGMGYMQDLADEAGAILISPQSRTRTWDVIRDGFGKDVESIDNALDSAFGTYNIDREHLAIGGFSDGASYALSLGLTNGQLFSHIIAFSPGFMVPGKKEGTPRVFVSHGKADAVLPIDRCSRRLIPQLQRAYNTTYHEFDGPHIVRPEEAKQAMQWFLAKPLKSEGLPLQKDGDVVAPAAQV